MTMQTVLRQPELVLPLAKFIKATNRFKDMQPMV